MDNLLHVEIRVLAANGIHIESFATLKECREMYGTYDGFGVYFRMREAGVELLKQVDDWFTFLQALRQAQALALEHGVPLVDRIHEGQ